MLDIESFSLYAWATPNARNWNYHKGRGIRYMGWLTISDSERFFPNELKRIAVEIVSPANIQANGFRSRVE